MRQKYQLKRDAGRDAGAFEQVLRWLPAPHSAAQLAQMDAALCAETSAKRRVKARIAVSALAIGAALTLPNLTAGAADAPELRVEMRKSSNPLTQPVWSPSVNVSAAKPLRPLAIDATNPDSFASFSAVREPGRVTALEVSSEGSARLDIGFNGAFSDLLEPVTVARLAPFGPSDHRFPEESSEQTAILARSTQITQITNAERFEPSATAQNQSEFSAAVSLPVEVSSPSPEVEGGQAGIVAISRPADEVGANRQAELALIEKSNLDARINGVLTGSLEFRQLDGTIAIRLGSVVDLLRNRFSDAELAEITAGGGLGSFLTLAEFQAAGIPIDYDPVYDEVTFGIDYQDAPNADKVQVDQIGVQSVGESRAMMDQIPR